MGQRIFALVLAVILWWVISISNQWIFIFLVPLAIVFSIAVLFGFPKEIPPRRSYLVK